MIFLWLLNAFQSYHTGIETKQTGKTTIARALSIVPYWNWNQGELWHTGGCAGTFNRTILELKQHIYHVVLLFSRSFNRTILELKQNKLLSIRCEGMLSIVPYWNWNQGLFPSCLRELHFQSYHTGIETYKRIKNSLQGSDFQSYHTGIET